MSESWKGSKQQRQADVGYINILNVKHGIKKRNKLACLEIIKTKPLDINNINVEIESSMDILTTEFMPMQRE